MKHTVAFLFGFFALNFSYSQITDSDTAKHRSTPTAQGINGKELDSLYSFLNLEVSDVRSIVIVKNGYVVAHSYKYPFYNGVLFELHSITKSVLSVLTGIAIKEGFIASEEQLVTDFLPASEIDNKEPYWKELTLKHLLTMSSGFAPFSGENLPADIKSAFAEIRFSKKPGEFYRYNEFDPQLLLFVLEKTTKMSIAQFAEKYLFKPLNINRYKWFKINGQYRGGSALRLDEIDIARIGWLMADSGKWGGRQLIDLRYWKSMQQGGSNSSYGYNIRLEPDGDFSAMGHFGQYLYCSPANRMVCFIASYTPDTLTQDFGNKLFEQFRELDNPSEEKVVNKLTSKSVYKKLTRKELPEWFEELDTKEFVGKANGLNANFKIAAANDSIVDIQLTAGEYIIHLIAGNGERKLAVSNLDETNNEDSETSKLYLSSNIDGDDKKLIITSRGIYSNEYFWAEILKVGGSLKFNFYNDNERMVQFSGTLKK